MVPTRNALRYGISLLLVATACSDDDRGTSSGASLSATTIDPPGTSGPSPGSSGTSSGSSDGGTTEGAGTNPTGGEETGGSGAVCGDGVCDVWEGCADCPD